MEELAAIEERNRLARELHDSVSQTMFSIILNVRSTQVLLQRDPTRLRPQLETLQKLAQSALVEMRSLIAQLRPKPNNYPAATSCDVVLLHPQQQKTILPPAAGISSAGSMCARPETRL